MKVKQPVLLIGLPLLVLMAWISGCGKRPACPTRADQPARVVADAFVAKVTSKDWTDATRFVLPGSAVARGLEDLHRTLQQAADKVVGDPSCREGWLVYRLRGDPSATMTINAQLEILLSLKNSHWKITGYVYNAAVTAYPS